MRGLRRWWFAALFLTGCTDGVLTDTLDTLRDNDLAGVAGPANRAALLPVERIPRAQFGSGNDAASLTFPSLVDDLPQLFDMTDASTPLFFFATSHAPSEGVGPMFNQRSCLGCHNSGPSNTPMSRTGRTATTNFEVVTAPDPSPTAAYTLFGDYFVAENRFDGLELFGGPVRHLGTAEGCFPDLIPDAAMDENLARGAIRQLAERAAPSYVGRGLMEAIYAPDIEALADAEDRLSSLSTRPPASACKGDCVSGRSNQNRADRAILGGDPVLRLARFGLRGAATTLIEMVSAGAQQHLGFTHPFSMEEEQNPYNAGLSCDIAPDPELTSEEVRNLRELVRSLAPPELDAALLVDTPTTAEDERIHDGARLFGVDLEAFRTRLVDGEAPLRLGEDDADRGIADDRQLNCVGCHTPIVVTGQSPSTVIGDALSNRWVPLFSDLLLHDMGSLPLEGDSDVVLGSHPFFNGVARNLADFALPGQGVATGGEWRTSPLLAFGLVGPPFLHDARVFVNPNAPAFFYFGSRTADEAGLALDLRRVEIVDTPTAIRAAIELHDLPQPPDLDLDGVPDYASCPDLGADRDWCSRNSPFRSEARNVIEKWHALTDDEQSAVVAFLQAL